MHSDYSSSQLFFSFDLTPVNLLSSFPTSSFNTFMPFVILWPTEISEGQSCEVFVNPSGGQGYHTTKVQIYSFPQ